VRVCLRHFRVRLLLLALILVTGAMLFKRFEPEKRHSLAEATYYTFSLIFGEPPEAFPRARTLQTLFFIVPILGLTVIIEGIVDFTLILRDRRRFEKRWCVMLSSSFKNHIVLVGFGRLGFPTFQILRRLGEAVVVIERDPNNEFLEEVRRDGSPLLIGDARREAILEDANIARARSIILASGDDLANLETALDARTLNPEIRVVLRMFDQNMADKVRDGFNIHLAMSQAALAAPAFATCALAPSTVTSVIVGDRLVAMQRWLVRRDGPLCGKTVAEVMRRYQVCIVEHCRPPASGTVCPDPELHLKPGDGLMLQGLIQSLEKLRQRAVPKLSTDETPVSGE
jgi:Trk K+ transport system NAD-binding subunit